VSKTSAGQDRRGIYLIVLARSLRSFSFGYMNVVIPIYFAKLGIGALGIGLIFTGAAASSALAMLFMSYLGDAYGKKKLLIILSVLMSLSGALYYVTRSFGGLALAAIFGGVGGGGGGGAGGGPFAPLQNAWLAEKTGDEDRTRYISMASTAGSLSSAFGSLLGFLPAAVGLPGFRALFALTAGLGLSQALVLAAASEKKAHGRAAVNVAVKRNAGLIAKFSLAGVFSGLGAGLVAPFFPYWFYVRYGVDLDKLTPLFFISSLVNAASYPVAAKLARSRGSINVITVTRLAGVGALAVLPLAPTFLSASAVYVARGALNGMGLPIRQSYSLAVVDEDARATSQGVSGISRRASSVAGPAITGYLMEYVSSSLPLFLSSALLGANALLYYAFFRDLRPPEERGGSR